MKEFIEFAEIAVALGIGFYLGFEGMARILKYFILQVEEVFNGETNQEDDDGWK